MIFTKYCYTNHTSDWIRTGTGEMTLSTAISDKVEKKQRSVANSVWEEKTSILLKYSGFNSTFSSFFQQVI